MAQEMSTGLDTGILIPLCANLTKLEGAADVTVELVLLLLGGDVGSETENKRTSRAVICIFFVFCVLDVECCQLFPKMIEVESAPLTSVTLTLPFWDDSHKLVRSGFTSRPSG